MRNASAAGVVALSVFVVGCGPAISVRPLYTAAEQITPIVEPRIEGDWIVVHLNSGDDEPTPWRMKIAAVNIHDPHGFYILEGHPDKPDADWGNKTLRLDVRLVRAGEALFFDAVVSNQSDFTFVGMVPLHLIGRLWVEQDGVRFRILDNAWANKHVPKSLRAAGAEEPTILTGSTTTLRELVALSANNLKAFRHVFYMCRPGIDCELRAVEDMLGRDDPDLPDLAKFFSRRGDHARAREAQIRQLDRR